MKLLDSFILDGSNRKHLWKVAVVAQLAMVIAIYGYEEYLIGAAIFTTILVGAFILDIATEVELKRRGFKR